jgi:hypothetical protein
MGRSRGRLLLVGVLLIGLLGATGCGPKSSGSSGSAPSAGATAAANPSAGADAGCQRVGSVNFDKTKFVLHAGLAFGAFHHFIYKPYKAGTLHGFGPLAKAGLAGVFTVHELKMAKADAESSSTLCHLVAPFDRATAAISASINKIKSGKATDQDIEGLNNDVNTVQSGAAANGVPAPDRVPTEHQLATGG